MWRCIFEKENIYTFDGKGELLITIMNSIHRKRAGVYPKTSHGDNANALQTARRPYPTSIYLAIAKDPTACRRSWKRKRLSSEAYTCCSWKDTLPHTSPKRLQRKAYLDDEAERRRGTTVLRERQSRGHCFGGSFRACTIRVPTPPRARWLPEPFRQSIFRPYCLR